MHQLSVAAYLAAFCLEALAIATCQQSLSAPWLKSETESISLTKRCIQGFCESFPPPQYCYSNSSFCGSWKTCGFLTALSFILNAAVLLVLAFSLLFKRRKKTVVLVRNLLFVSIIFQLVTLVGLPIVVDSADLFRKQDWQWAGGYYMLLSSATCGLFLLCEMMVFRSIVKLHDDHEIDSDEEDSYFSETLDQVSIDENVPEEQLDFYIFNKQARRSALNRYT